MSELSDYFHSPNVELYSPNERDHNLSFAYSLLVFVDRDGADRLERTPAGFTWSKAGDVVGTFPMRTPDPFPPLLDTLLMVFERDEFVREYLGITYEADGVFRFSRK